MLVHTISGVPRALSDMRKEGRLIHERKKPMIKIIAAAAFVVAPWHPAHAPAIVGSIPEEFRGDWCQENTKDNIFKPGGCKLKAGSLSIRAPPKEARSNPVSRRGRLLTPDGYR